MFLFALVRFDVFRAFTVSSRLAFSLVCPLLPGSWVRICIGLGVVLVGGMVAAVIRLRAGRKARCTEDDAGAGHDSDLDFTWDGYDDLVLTAAV